MCISTPGTWAFTFYPAILPLDFTEKYFSGFLVPNGKIWRNSPAKCFGLFHSKGIRIENFR